MNDLIQTAVRQVIAQSAQVVTVVLIGSAARGKRAEQSDIDILVISEDHPNARLHMSGFHIQQISKATFLANLKNGEDFESWCIRFGVPLHDSGIWTEILKSPFAAKWPDWKLKVIHGVRRLLLGNTMLEIGDRDAAAEELMYTMGHVARGLLLKMQVFPLSRPELAEQVAELGYRQLANFHEELRNHGSVSSERLELAVRYSKKLLCHLDAATYGRYWEEYRSKKRSKIGQTRQRRSPDIRRDQV